MRCLYAKIKDDGRSHASDYQLFLIEMSASEHILLSYPDGTELGILNDHHSKIWKELTAIPSIRFEALCQNHVLHDTVSRAEKAGDAKIRVNVNVYGPKSSSKDVGDRLSSHKVYLQKPNFYENAVIYDNPHIITFADMPTCRGLAGEQLRKTDQESENVTPDPERLRKTVSEVYSSLKRGTRLDGFKGDERLNTKLLL